MRLELRFKLDYGEISDPKCILTDEHPASSYGLPVLVDFVDEKTAWGPRDGNEITTARNIVEGWIAQNPDKLEEIEFCKKFLSASPK